MAPDPLDSDALMARLEVLRSCPPVDRNMVAITALRELGAATVFRCTRHQGLMTFAGVAAHLRRFGAHAPGLLRIDPRLLSKFQSTKKPASARTTLTG